MNENRKARERLDALLTALEDEVLSENTQLPSDVGPLRAEIKELILEHRKSPDQSATNTAGTVVKNKVANAIELMSRWFGLHQHSSPSKIGKRVSMAFSADQERVSNRGRFSSKHADSNFERKREDKEE